jgi:aconitate hydratase
VIAGKEYGTGSSRDWAAKGSRLLGVAAVIAESYERIHRSNLIGMGVLPLQFRDGESYASLGLTGRETFDVSGLQARAARAGAERTVSVARVADDGAATEFTVLARLDTPQEREYYRHGGILHFVLRQLLGTPEQEAAPAAPPAAGAASPRPNRRGPTAAAQEPPRLTPGSQPRAGHRPAPFRHRRARPTPCRAG